MKHKTNWINLALLVLLIATQLLLTQPAKASPLPDGEGPKSPTTTPPPANICQTGQVLAGWQTVKGLVMKYTGGSTVRVFVNSDGFEYFLWEMLLPTMEGEIKAQTLIDDIRTTFQKCGSQFRYVTQGGTFKVPVLDVCEMGSPKQSIPEGSSSEVLKQWGSEPGSLWYTLLLQTSGKEFRLLEKLEKSTGGKWSTQQKYVASTPIAPRATLSFYKGSGELFTYIKRCPSGGYKFFTRQTPGFRYP